MFMRERLGEEYGGTVSAATSFGLFVQLDGLYVEGLIHITELGGEYYRFDEARQELRGERSGVRYGVGTRVRVQVSRVDLDSRKIDFRMVREGAEPRQPSAAGTRRKGRTADAGVEVSAQDELAEIRELDREVKRGGKTAKAGKSSPKGASKGRTRVSVAATVGGGRTAAAGKKAAGRPRTSGKR
jgi:ribonuclease R